MGVLEERYASPEMTAIWGDKQRIHVAREIWLAVMEAQAKLPDSPVTEHDVKVYRSVANEIDLAEHRNAERIAGHETVGWIEVFNEHAAAADPTVVDKIHLGMTSCDITENITIWQVRKSLWLLRDRASAVLSRLLTGMTDYRRVRVVARTHGQPAQLTTLGKRYAMYAAELIQGLAGCEQMAAALPLRGVVGAVGNNVDMAELLGDAHTAHQVSVAVASELGFESGYAAIGQVTPRLTDLAVASMVGQVCSGPASMALTIRLMNMLGLARERPRPGQVGSSAMPHKTNPRYAERITALHRVVNGYMSMLSGLAGTTWNEGDVSDSATRRIAFPGLFMTADGLLRSFMVALDRFEPDLEAIESEADEYRYEVSTGRILARAVAKGKGREAAHQAIREARGDEERLAHDDRLGLTHSEILDLIETPSIGDADLQVNRVREWASRLVGEHYLASGYDPGEML